MAKDDAVGVVPRSIAASYLCLVRPSPHLLARHGSSASFGSSRRRNAGP